MSELEWMLQNFRIRITNLTKQKINDDDVPNYVRVSLDDICESVADDICKDILNEKCVKVEVKK